MADKRGKPTGLFVGGLILDIVAIFGYIIALVVILVMMAVVVTMGATTGAVIAGEEGAQQAVDQVSHDATFTMLATIFGCLSGYSLVVGLPCSIMALSFCKNANSRGAARAAGILGIFASLSTIFIPVELIGAIKMLAFKTSDFE
ncbi:MAG: hypothetical protein IJK27_03595 [Bacilli bacterium]|nr:hypothetical protein [Bacilli bacterium]